ncbi:SDR family oxidoreductase [Parasalinivibrio latis]|uniref:SDR family NAD(P)-dependent oxidoreductase n=1 Tax=Parasalinivibrio latis TaxID=2952610 RepID=UPI0030E2D525
MEIENKVALVTGAGGTLGEAIVRRFVELGMKVAMIDIDGTRLLDLAEELGENTHPIAIDLSNEEAIDFACQEVRAKWGKVDILVNNAGILTNNKAAETSSEEWRKVMAVNLDSAFLLSREWLPSMKEQGWGRIINICSLAAKTGGLTAGTAYTTSKGGMTALTFSLAREAAEFGVTVNGIAPAYIKTKMVMEQLTEAQREALLDAIPVRRFCEAEEVAHVVEFLADPLSGFITGEVVDINGGLHLD